MNPEQEAQAKADLLAAADLIEQRGHCQFVYENQKGCLCASGALQLAISGSSNDLYTRSGRSDVAGDGWARRFADACLLAKREVHKTHRHLYDIISFNDAYGRRAAEVVALLRRAGAPVITEADGAIA